MLCDFLPRYNQRFAVPATQPGTASRQPEDGFIPEEVFCFKYQRMVGADNVVRFGKHRLQIMSSNGRLSYARCRVEVQQRPDASLAIYYRGKSLPTEPAPVEATVLRASTPKQPEMAAANRATNKPAPDHPWRQWVYR